jgi:alkenylglycerophosphocholine/alkenylglycerophosphoethanolamine hydrolase
LKAKLNILFFIAAFVYLLSILLNISLLQILTKPIPVLCLILMIKANDPLKKLMSIAFIFCLLGDIFLLDKDYFLFGLGSFLIGHIFFILAFIKKNSQLKFNLFMPYLIYGSVAFIFLFPYLKSMTYPVLAYVTVIMSMLWRANAQLGVSVGSKLAFYGALLFGISDSILAFNMFYMPFIYASYLIMITYWGAQYYLYKSIE